MRTIATFQASLCGTIAGMDALSDLLADVRLRGAVFVRTRLGAVGHLDVSEAMPDAASGGEGGQPCFHLVTEGRVWLHPGDGTEPILLKAGEVAFVPRGSKHRLTGQEATNGLLPAVDLREQWEATRASGATLVESLKPGSFEPTMARTLSGIVQIDGVAPAWLWRGLPTFTTLQWGEGRVPHWLTIGLAYLDQELSRERLARQAVIDRLGDIVFIQSMRSYLEGSHRAPTGWLMGLKDSMVSRVLGAMHREPQQPWTLASLAKVGCVSRTVLAERFTQMLGEPPLGYLTRHRMHVAARRLRRSADPVSEVARSVGYLSAAAFAQAFKREFECTPRDWRSADVPAQA
jgi:AraC-like DNA-binding protein